LVKEGVYTITVTDGEYNFLASAVVAFYDATKPEEEWPGPGEGICEARKVKRKCMAKSDFHNGRWEMR